MSLRLRLFHLLMMLLNAILLALLTVSISERKAETRAADGILRKVCIGIGVGIAAVAAATFAFAISGHGT